jgi:hypothetical protein
MPGAGSLSALPAGEALKKDSSLKSEEALKKDWTLEVRIIMALEVRIIIIIVIAGT